MKKVSHSVLLSPRLRRITAPNPSVMTGDGTNTYLIQDFDGSGDYVVVDPGPPSDVHVRNIVAATNGNIHSIIVTHTHADHSPSAATLAELTGAKLLGMKSSNAHLQDATFLPTHVIRHDETIVVGGCRIRAIHTPGHVDNHFCFLLENDGILLAGDHIMNGSTVVIVPPQGNMKDYIASLIRLKDYQLKAIAPGHGELMERPYDVIDGLVKHRLARESKVLHALQIAGTGGLDELVVAVYDDVDASLHVLAKYSLEAHLIKLCDEGAAKYCDDSRVWFLT